MEGQEGSRNQESNLVKRPHQPHLADGPSGFCNYTGACCVCAFSTEFKKAFPLTTRSPRTWATSALGGFCLWSLCCVCALCCACWLHESRPGPALWHSSCPHRWFVRTCPSRRAQQKPHACMARLAHVDLTKALSFSISLSLRLGAFGINNT